jgi:hypothetical protein
MAKEDGRKRLPPYISYRTFLNFLERLQQGIPSRIDRSYWSERLSGSTGVQLTSALRYMGLIDGSNIPGSRLRQLVAARGDERADALRQITLDSYDFLLQQHFDPETATYAQLEEVFHSNFQITDSVKRKCVKFFVALASDAGIELSPFILKKVRSLRTTVSAAKQSAKRTAPKPKRNFGVPQTMEEVATEVSWDRMLLSKFPTFDPNWPDNVKLGWFEAFDSLKFPVFDPNWSDEVKVKWFEAFDKLIDKDFKRRQSQD